MSKDMNTVVASDLRHYVTIEQAAETQNEYGEVIRTWSVWKKRWASIRPLSGRERWSATQAQADVSHMVVMRHTAGIVPKMRIVYGERTFEIGSVLNIDERNRVMHLLCTEAIG